jgi:hypothetical protein
MTHRLNSFVAAVICAALWGGACRAQELTDNALQARADIRTVYRFSDVFVYDGELGIRRQISGLDWSAAYFRPSITYRLSHLLAVRGGVRFGWARAGADVTELRPWEGVQVFWPTFGVVTFDQYVRFEQRFLSVDGGDREFVHRFRYRLRAKTDHRLVLGLSTPSFALVAWEFFSNLNKLDSELFVRSDRFYLGVGNRVSRKWTLQLQYYWQRSRVGADESLKLYDHVVRLRVGWVIN